MGFRSKLCFRYLTTHENRAWNRLVSVLSGEYAQRFEDIYLIGNLMADGREIDALIVKKDALIVIDFKDYGGALEISENQPWTASGVIINSERKNPFLQLSDNKYAVLNVLKNKLPEGYESWINIGHINALVLFHQPIEYDTGNLQVDLSAPVSRWFNICDIDHVIQTINEITSRQTSLRGERVETVLKCLGVADILEIEQIAHVGPLESAAPVAPVAPVAPAAPVAPVAPVASVKDHSVPKSESTKIDENLNFADLYYSTAKSLDTIRLVIVGQDPYPTNANGVAFCKNSYYELYQEDCSGGIVLKSMGIDKEKARNISRKSPKNLFYELLTSCGICFINVFNRIYDQLSIEEIILAAEEARDFNTPILQRAKTIVLLGKGKTKSTFEKYYPDVTYHQVLIHPSPKAKAGNEVEWTETWETEKLANLMVD